MKQIQLASISAKTVRDALKTGEDVVIVDGEEPLVRLVSVAAEMKQRNAYFVHYPHDPAECFGTCWRHNGAAEQEQQQEAAADEPQPVPVG